MLRQQLLDAHGRAGTLSKYVAQAMGTLQDREAWWRSAAAASLGERAVLLEQAKAQEVTPFGQMNQMGQALQRFSTDATLNESQRRDQERVFASVQAYAQNLRSAGLELERQRQATLQNAEAKVKHMVHEASQQYAVAEKRAVEAEDNLRQLQLQKLEIEKSMRTHWEQLTA